MLLKISEDRRPLYLAWIRFKKNRLGVVGGCLVLFFVVLGLAAPLIPQPKISLADRLQPPSLYHPFGTDNVGRDLLVMSVQGATLSLKVGLLAVLFSTILGVVIGAISGYLGGGVDSVLMRMTDLMLTMPSIILVIVAVSMFKIRSVDLVILVFTVFGWPRLARIVRGEFLSLRERPYVSASRIFGASTFDLVFKHMLPNAISSITTVSTLNFSTFIVAEASLSFLGFGDPYAISWGTILAAGRAYLQAAWWISTLPGLVLFISALGFNLLGEGLRDVLATVE